MPQGSLAGPVLFNVFLNDLLSTLEPLYTVFNYADDKSLSISHAELQTTVIADPWVVKGSLELAATCGCALEW